MAITNVARIGVFNVDALGNKIDKESSTVNSLRYSRQEHLIIQDDNIPNSFGYPTIREYIEAESDDGRVLMHVDQTLLVTSDLVGGGPGSNDQATDAFGRLRISQPFTLFDSQHRYVENSKWDTSIVTGGSKSYNANASVVNLNVNTASGAEVLRETKRVMVYQPGKSLLIQTTFTMNTPKTNLRQRVGYFGSTNGIFFEVNDFTANFVLRSSSSGVTNERRVSQTQWNIDALDGTGPSGISLNDFSKSLILYTDIEWLGVGDARIGFVINGKYIHCHTFKHDPVDNGISGTYMTTACLPLRYEITNTGPTSSNSTLKQICSNVISEGGYELTSQSHNVDLGVDSRTLLTKGVDYPIISIKLNSNRLDAVVLPSSASIMVTSNQYVRWSILLNATLTGASWSTHSNGTIDYDTSATAISGGTVLTSGYIDKGSVINIASDVDFKYQLGRTIAGVSDIITLMMTPANNNTGILADLSWYEIIT